MGFLQGEVVRSLSGHDAGRIHFVIKTEQDFLYLADGKRRKAASPKKKRQKHVRSEGNWQHPVATRLQRGETVLDSEIRRALAAFRDRFSDNQGGMTLGEKRHD